MIRVFEKTGGAGSAVPASRTASAEDLVGSGELDLALAERDILTPGFSGFDVRMGHPGGVVGGDERGLAFRFGEDGIGLRIADLRSELPAVGHQAKEIHGDHEEKKIGDDDGVQLSARPLHEAPLILFIFGHCDIKSIGLNIPHRSIPVKSFVINSLQSNGKAQYEVSA
jgi:hypothetical protein